MTHNYEIEIWLTEVTGDNDAVYERYKWFILKGGKQIAESRQSYGRRRDAVRQAKKFAEETYPHIKIKDRR